MDETYGKLNRAWKSTCRIVLGDEIGDVNDYEHWLNEYNWPVTEEKTHEGKMVYLSVDDYCKSAKFGRFSELNWAKKYGPLSINELKDIDSIVTAVQDRITYTGNIILGKSEAIEKCSNILDCFYAYNSSHISDSKYIACSNALIYNEYLFGCRQVGESGNGIKGIECWKAKRFFNNFCVTECEDCYITASG